MDEKEKRKLIFHLLGKGSFAKEQEIAHHFKTTVFRHSISVARMSLRIAKALRISVNESDLLTGALLHDYFLYDWHKKRSHHGLHGFTHAKVAADNAKKDYCINKRVYHIIYTHMFPLNITHVPRSREAWIVTIADKIVAFREQTEGIAERLRRPGKKEFTKRRFVHA